MESVWVEEYDELKRKHNKLKQKLSKLKKAGNDLYKAGYWQCDRGVDEKKLWEALRDALGRKKGTSPKEVYFV